MKWQEALQTVGEEPLFETGLLLAGDVDPTDVRRQLSRWVGQGKLRRLRRGLYAPAPPFAKTEADPFVVANRLVHPSYVSLESALAFYSLIPEFVAVVTSVTTRRPELRDTPLGVYEFRHVGTRLFWGYRVAAPAPGGEAFVATPEKALLDLIYLRPRSDSAAFLSELRLQNLERLDLDELRRQAERFASPKVSRAAALVEQMARAEAQEFQTR